MIKLLSLTWHQVHDDRSKLEVALQDFVVLLDNLSDSDVYLRDERVFH